MSGSQLERGRLDDGTSIVIKRVDANADWIMQATGDEGRIATLWSEGIFGCWSRFVERSGPQDARHMAGVSVAERHAVIR
jgi:hypothetical protein